MTKTRRYGTSTLAAIGGLLLGAMPASAQDQNAPPGGTPPTTTGSTASTASAISAPKAADDMTGSLGFGVGVIPNVQLVGTSGQVAIKYWWSDTLAFVPALTPSAADIIVLKPPGPVTVRSLTSKVEASMGNSL